MEQISWINPRGDASSFVLLLAALVTVVVAAVVLTYWLRRRNARQKFYDEVEQLSLSIDEERTLTTLVLQNAKDEPVKVLYSLPVFDRIAGTEIERVLGSTASQETKESFIDHIYNIRLKTYFSPDEEQVVAT